MAKNYNLEIKEAVENFLEEDDWNYSFDEKNALFRFGLQMRGNMKNIQYTVRLNERDYNVYAVSPLSADRDDSEQMGKMAEFICRANYGLRDGNFEMDFDDGELRYKCYMNCNGAIPTKEMIAASIYCPAAMFERYSKGIVRVLFSDMSAADAVEMCEGGQEPHEDHVDDGEEDTSSRLLEMLRELRDELEDLEDLEGSGDTEKSEDSDDAMPAATDE